MKIAVSAESTVDLTKELLKEFNKKHQYIVMHPVSERIIKRPRKEY